MTLSGTHPIRVDSTETFIAVDDTVIISTECDPDFTDPYGDGCATYLDEGWCSGTQRVFLIWSIMTSNGAYQTGLNCPQCGCTDTYIAPLTAFPEETLGRHAKQLKTTEKLP